MITDKQRDDLIYTFKLNYVRTMSPFLKEGEEPTREERKYFRQQEVIYRSLCNLVQLAVNTIVEATQEKKHEHL